MSLGFGLGFRPPHYDEATAKKWDEVDWFEVISENFMAVGGRPRQFLEKLSSLYPIALHGVGLSIAGPDPLDQRYLIELRRLEQWVKPVLVTDHLCWTSHRGKQSYDLLPFPLTKRSLGYVQSRVAQVQDFLGRQILLENPSAYLAYQESEMPEAAFFNELAERTGCGILLDINNLVVNRKNLGQDPGAYIRDLNQNTVGQFHLAGHEVHPEVAIDTHDHPIDDETLSWFALASEKWPDAPVLVEWDSKIPPFSGLLEQLEIARSHHRGWAEKEERDSKQRPDALQLVSAPKPESYRLWHAMTSGNTLPISGTGSTPTPPEVGTQVYREGYFARLQDTLKDLLKTFYFIAEDQAFALLIKDFIKHHQGFAPFSLNDIAPEFAAYLGESTLPIDYGVDRQIMVDLARFDSMRCLTYLAPECATVVTPNDLGNLSPEDWQTKRFFTVPHFHLARFCCDPQPVWRGALAGALVEVPVLSPHVYGFGRDHTGEVWMRQLSPDQERWLQMALARGFLLSDLCDEADEATVQRAVAQIVEWVTLGILRW